MLINIYPSRCSAHSFIVFTTTSMWSVVIAKLTVTHLVNKSPAFCGTRRLTTVLTRSRHWYLF